MSNPLPTARQPSTRLWTGVLFVALLATGGCATKVERLDPGTVRDLSGAWNDTDSRLVSQQMIGEMLDSGWLARAGRELPTVIVGEVRNLSHEHINVQAFIADIEHNLINSGRIRFVAARDEREELREERKDQDLHARNDTRKPMGRERGADYMLMGTLSTIVDVAAKEQVRFYQVDLNLVSLADNSKVWAGQKKIKKHIERPKLRF